MSRPFSSSSSGLYHIEGEDSVCESRRHEIESPNFPFGAPVSYYRDLDSRNEVAIARSLNVPILILRGARDYQVTDEDGASAPEAALN